MMHMRITTNKFLLTIVAFTVLFSMQATAQTWSSKQAKKWIANREWANGLVNVNPYKDTDPVEFATQYHKEKSRWDKAFTWMATHDVATLAPGRYEIDGTHCFANVQDAVLKTAKNVNIESHKKYIDLQWCVTGVERYGIVNAKDAIIKVPYKPDVMYWNTDKIKYVNSNPHMFFLFFPKNYHRACVLPKGGIDKIRKVCIKIEYDEDK